jgi:hypothetical protein
MNLTNVAAFIKKYTGVIAALIVIPTLLVAIILIYKNRLESQLPLLNQPALALFSPKIEGINTQDLKGPQDPLSRLPVYKVDQNIDFLKDSQSLAQKLGISTPPIPTNDINLGKGNIYADKDNVISIYKNSVSYQKLNLKPQNGNFEKEKAASIAEKYLAGLGFNTDNLLVTGSSLQTFVGYNILETPDPQKADLITLDFGYALSGIQTISSQSAINASVDISGQVTSFNFRGLGSTQKLDTYSLISFKEAIQTLTSGKGMVIAMEGLGGYASQLGSLNQINMTSANLAYYLPVNTMAPIQPIWVFDGQTTVKNSVVKIKVAIPAIQEKFFKKT